MKAPNLRAGARIAVNQRAELNSGTAWFPCRILDMSDNGLLLVCNKSLVVGQILDLRCELYLGKRLECKVEIRHADEAAIGTRIVRIDRRSIDLLQLFLQEHYSEHLNKSG